LEKDILFEPLRFRNLTVKNRIFRSSLSGRFDNYDGSGTQTRINWEEKFARGGVGTIISAFAPVHIHGRILPNYATVDSDETVPFWRALGARIHQYDCKYILQLSHAGRQQDIKGIENAGRKALSSTGKTESFHGFQCRSMTVEEICKTTQLFADGAVRARDAGLDGIELHACNGYLITQFLSSAINNRTDQYGGSLENRARFLLDVIKAIRHRIGDDYHLQVKLSATDHHNAVIFWEKKGNTIEDSLRICQWIEEAGADAIHVSTGSMFPHPRNPAGDFPLDAAATAYGSMLSSGIYTLRNYYLFRCRSLRWIFRYLWNRTKSGAIEGISIEDARKIKARVNIPVLCTGGFQSASYIRRVLQDGYCDGVTIARALIANNDLVRIFEQGKDQPERPCTYCNKCLIHVLEDPLGCYETARYGGDHDRMIREVMSVFRPTDVPNLTAEIALPSLQPAPAARRSLDD